MKRRSFINLLGAALSAPAMPALAVTPANLTSLAAAHARKYPFVSAVGLSRGLEVPLKQAQALLLDLSNTGVVGPVSSCGTGPIHASSKVFRPIAPVSAAQASRAAKQVRDKTAAPEISETHKVAKDWVAHLQNLCADSGLTLSEKAQEVAL